METTDEFCEIAVVDSHDNRERLSYRVIGAAMTVHRALGCGFLESVYEKALAEELRARKMRCTRQAPMSVRYRGELVGRFRADFVVENRLVIELKAVTAISPACQAQLLNYLKASDLRVGLILNFGAPSLQVKRLANSVTTSRAGNSPKTAPQMAQITQMTQKQ